MKAVGVDLGARRVGIAVSDDLALLAHPRPYLDGRNRGALLAALAALARSEDIEIFVVGLPRSLDGSEGRGARRARTIAAEIERATGVPVELVDEWLTTVEAQARLAEQGVNERDSRERIDSAAAAVLLQAWMNAREGAERTT